MITVGLDEVGRGGWAGPLVAGAVVLTQPIIGLNDSKLLSAKRRRVLSDQIILEAAAYGLGWVEPGEVDELGVTAAVGLAMQRALSLISVKYDELIIDGNYNFFPNDDRARAVIKADQTVPAVSAASIIAKVARDQRMTELAEEFPDYGFEKHVGYGTALHIERLKLYGVSQLHRKSYRPVKALLQ